VAKPLADSVAAKIFALLEPHEMCTASRACRTLAAWSRLPQLEPVWKDW
jgi:hypothetical protein